MALTAHSDAHLPVPGNAQHYRRITWRPRSSILQVFVLGHAKSFKLDFNWLKQGNITTWSDVHRLVSCLVNEPGVLVKKRNDEPVALESDWEPSAHDGLEYTYKPRMSRL